MSININVPGMPSVITTDIVFNGLIGSFNTSNLENILWIIDNRLKNLEFENEIFRYVLNDQITKKQGNNLIELYNSNEVDNMNILTGIRTNLRLGTVLKEVPGIYD